MRRAVIPFLVLLCCGIVSAQPRALVNNPKYHKAVGALDFSRAGTYRNLLDGIDASTDAAHRTVTIDVDGYAKTTVSIKIVRGGDAAKITLTCSGSLDGGAGYGSVQSRAVGAGTGTLSDFHDSKVVGASLTYLVDYAVGTYTHFRCVVATDTANILDLLTVQATSEVGR